MAIRLVFISETFVLEYFQSMNNQYQQSPEELLIRLEEMLLTGEITQQQLKELMS